MFNTVPKGLIMKPWIKRTLAGIFGASIIVGGLTACSSGAHRHGPMSPEKMAEVRAKVVDRVSGKLDLNDAQKQKLNVLADRMEAQRTAFLGKTADPRAEAQAIVAGAKFDRARAQSLLEEKTRAVQTNSPEVIDALADFYDSLNPDQQQKVRELMQRRRGWMARG
jgi:periplasmic protein CpxP/Spy